MVILWSSIRLKETVRKDQDVGNIRRQITGCYLDRPCISRMTTKTIRRGHHNDIYDQTVAYFWTMKAIWRLYLLPQMMFRDLLLPKPPEPEPPVIMRGIIPNPMPGATMESPAITIPPIPPIMPPPRMMASSLSPRPFPDRTDTMMNTYTACPLFMMMERERKKVEYCDEHKKERHLMRESVSRITLIYMYMYDSLIRFFQRRLIIVREGIENGFRLSLFSSTFWKPDLNKTKCM